MIRPSNPTLLLCIRKRGWVWLYSVVPDVHVDCTCCLQGILPERKLTLPEELSFVVDEKVLAAVDCAKENYKQKVYLVNKRYCTCGLSFIPTWRYQPCSYTSQKARCRSWTKLMWRPDPWLADWAPMLVGSIFSFDYGSSQSLLFSEARPYLFDSSSPFLNIGLFNF